MSTITQSQGEVTTPDSAPTGSARDAFPATNFAAHPSDLFRRGYDTLEIANLLQIPEHQVLRIINLERSHRLGKPYPYAPYQQPSDNRAPRIPFAGKDYSERRLDGGAR